MLLKRILGLIFHRKSGRTIAGIPLGLRACTYAKSLWSLRRAVEDKARHRRTGVDLGKTLWEPSAVTSRDVNFAGSP